MNLEEFKIDLETKLAAMSDDELRAGLENVGCVFADPWLEALLSEHATVAVTASGLDVSAAANSNELALAA